MDSFKKILAGLFALLFVTTSVLALILFNLDRHAFTAETYRQVFANEGFYNQIPAVMANALAASASDQSGLPRVMQGFSTQNWETFLRAMLPAETLKTIGDEALNSIFAYLDNQSDSAQISLAPLKASLTSDAGAQAVFALLSAEPECTLEQIEQMGGAIFGQGQIQFCNPPEMIQALITPILQAQLQLAAAALPDQITIARADSASQQTDPRQRLKVIRLMMRLSPLVPLAFLLMVTILAINSLKSWLTWWGIPFSITGVIAVLIGLAGAPVTGFVLQKILVNKIPAYLPVIMLDYAGELAAAMVQQLLKPILWQGLILAVIGTIMIAILFFIKGKEKNIKRRY